MSNVVEFPCAAPFAAEFNRVKTELADVLRVVSTETEMDSYAVKEAEDLGELAGIIQATAAKLAEASPNWIALSRAIAGHWR